MAGLVCKAQADADATSGWYKVPGVILHVHLKQSVIFLQESFVAFPPCAAQTQLADRLSCRYSCGGSHMPSGFHSKSTFGARGFWQQL